jgi:enoyl-CoA hydratase/carnithine racemase
MTQVTVASDGAVLAITMNRPDKKNALTAEMYQAMADALKAAEADASVRAVVIRGVEGAFTAGNDLQDFLSNPPRSKESPVFQFLAAITSAQKPLVAAVDGVAVGIGTTMLLHCDFVYASDRARFALPFVNLGLCPEAASSFLLPMVAGYQRAAKLLLLGEPFSVEEAREAGIITEVVAPESVVPSAMATARKLAERPQSSVRATKNLLKKQTQAAMIAALNEESDTFTRMLGEPAAKEAFSAFLGKRKPDFSKLG